MINKILYFMNDECNIKERALWRSKEVSVFVGLKV